MAKHAVDILISGGGLAGLIAAAAFGHHGYSVILVDPQPPETTGDTGKIDLRSTAYLQPAKALLSEIGLWSACARHAVPLQSLRIIDCTGDPPKVRDEREFRSAEMGNGPFGWNLLNWLTRREFLGYLTKQPNIELRFGVGFTGLMTRTNAAIVSLSDGSRVTTKLVVAADGRHSPVRDAVGISVKTTRYGQKSLAFTATHARPHDNVSTEIYHEGGPFTMVPLADIGGKPASAIVWMNAGRRALDLAKMSPDPFNDEMTRRSAGLFGPMVLASERAVWPIITQKASHLTAERVAIIAEAAHVLPPIGAQGLNTSLNDIATLLEAAKAFRGDLGAPGMLAAYERSRLPDISRRARVIDIFNRVTRSGDTALQSLRLLGLKSVHDIAPVRRSLMRAGMGPR